MPITSEIVNFGRDLIKFDNIDINQGIIYFFFVINKVALRETNSHIPIYNTLTLRNIGLRPEPIEISFFVGNYTTFKITLIIAEENKKNIINQENIESKKIKELNEFKVNKESKDNKNSNVNKEKKPLNLSQILDSDTHINFKEKIKYYSDVNKSNSEQSKSILKKKNPKIDIEDLECQAYQSPNKNDDNLNDDIEEKNKTFWKKLSVPVLEQHVKSQFDIDEDIEQNEYYLKGINYDTYLSMLKSEKKKEYERRENFCKGFFIASFPQAKGKVIENSQSFPAPCGHKECSSLPAMQPEIISRYPLQDTKTFELNILKLCAKVQTESVWVLIFLVKKLHLKFMT